jgi:hypothetical protein
MYQSLNFGYIRRLESQKRVPIVGGNFWLWDVTKRRGSPVWISRELLESSASLSLKMNGYILSFS